VWGLAPGRRVVKGIAHVDPRLAVAGVGPFARLSLEKVNGRSFRRAASRDEAFDDWGVGSPYENFEFRGTVLRTEDLRFRTSFTLKSTLRRLLNTAVLTLLSYLAAAAWFIPRTLELTGTAQVVATALVLLLPLAISAPLFLKYARAAFLDLPVDSYLADFGKAIAEALRETGMAATKPEQVRVTETAEGTYEVHLDTNDSAASAAFAACFGDVFAPIVDQRYLVVREEVSLSGTFYRPVWYVLRSVLRMFRRRNVAYHPVPAMFGRKRGSAEIFGQAWAKWVGGGRLLYTRSEEGAAVLLAERARARRLARTTEVDEWR
jgi:hypothetical protein